MKGGLMLLVLGGALAVWPAVDYVREFAAVDACLDAGGSFDYAHSRCDRVETHQFVAYSNRHPTSVRIGALGGALFMVGVVVLVREPKRRSP
jgi:hypothetical protein